MPWQLSINMAIHRGQLPCCHCLCLEDFYKVLPKLLFGKSQKQKRAIANGPRYEELNCINCINGMKFIKQVQQQSTDMDITPQDERQNTRYAATRTIYRESNNRHAQLWQAKRLKNAIVMQLLQSNSYKFQKCMYRLQCQSSS